MRKSKLKPYIWVLGLGMILASCDHGPGTTSEPVSGSSVEPDTSVVPSDPGSEPPPGPKLKNGIESLIGADAAKRTEILGTLEKYAVDNMLTGLPLTENGGYAMYNPRVVKGTENYILGYGFGILREGSLAAPLTHEEVLKPTYWNEGDSSDPGKINALDDNGAQVSGLYDYIASGYFGIKMNSGKNGYDWYGVLSSQDHAFIVKDGVAKYPDDPEETSTTWRVYVRTGEAGGVKFHTNSADPDRKAFDGRYVTLDDYLNAFKILLCKKFNYYRGSELSKGSGYSYISGAKEYWDATTNGIDETAFAGVGVKGGHDDAKGDYLEFTLGAPTNRFYARYALASNLYAPINLDFFNLVTENGSQAKNYGGYNSDKSFTPVDNILSTNSLALESWETDVGIAFKRNDDWFERVQDPNLYQIPGVYVHIWEAAKESPTYMFEQFLAGKIDSASIPKDYVEQYAADERTTTVPGSTVLKLNVNSCTQEEWNALFGSNGTIAQLGDDAYACKPWMSNENFIKGLFFSIDRQEYAAKRGSIAATTYFSSAYLSDPEAGQSYNATDEHKAAVADFWGDTLETGGYSEALSRAAFNDAIDELLASGDVKDGDKLTIECWWMAKSQIQNNGVDIAEYVQTAFNGSSNAQAHNLTLEFKNSAVDVWSDCYDKHLQIGMFDLGYGAINGNTQDPLNFMEVLKSDNSSGFTLNWGKDTSELDLAYNNETWSFDSLWAAVDHGVVLKDGKPVTPAEISGASVEVVTKEVPGETSEDPSTTEYGLDVSFTVTSGISLLEQAAAAGDASAAELLEIPEADWYLGIGNICTAFNSNMGGVDYDLDGTPYDAYWMNDDYDLTWYQELTGSGWATYYANEGEEIMAFTDPWVTIDEPEVDWLIADEELGSITMTAHITGGFGLKAVKSGGVQIMVDVNQIINGVESKSQVVLSLLFDVPAALQVEA